MHDIQYMIRGVWVLSSRPQGKTRLASRLALLNYLIKCCGFLLFTNLVRPILVEFPKVYKFR